MGRKIIVVRHGETQGNREGRFQVEDIPLSERGNKQAKLVAQRILSEYGSRVKKIVSSDLKRAKETATHIYEALNDVEGLVFETHSILQERNFGDLRGQLISDVMARVNIVEPEYRPDNGESFNDFDKRMEKAFDFIKYQAKTTLINQNVNDEEVIVVVTHGLVKTRMAKNHFDHGENRFPPKNTKNFMFHNTSITVIEVEENEEKAKVKLLNCTKHLPAELHADIHQEERKFQPKSIEKEDNKTKSKL